MWIRCFFLCTCVAANAGDPFAVTDHPDRWKVERFQGPLGQLRAFEGHQRTVKSRERPAEAPKTPWILSKTGIPCHPYKSEGKTYPGCHPDGWCCLDVTCSRTASCDAASSATAAEPPLQLPRDPVVTGCELETHGSHGSFSWDVELEKNFNLMFVLLQDDMDGLEEEQVESLVKLCSSMPLRLVLMSYKTSKDDIQQLMTRSEQQLQRLVASLSQEEQERVGQSFVLASQPAWHVSFNSCWLPSVLHSWSKDEAILQFSEAEGGAELASTRPQTIRGDWALDLASLTAPRSSPLRWAGGLCEEQDLESRWPPASTDLTDTIALVARGSCSHYHKARQAQDMGAVGVVIFSHNDEPVAMSCAAPDPCDETLSIPVLMTTRSIGETLLEEMFNSTTGSEGLLATLLTQRRGPGLVGVLGHQGGLWYNSPIGLSRLEDELVGMEHRRQLLQRREELAAQGALRIDVFSGADFPGGLTAPWQSSHAQQIRRFTQLDIELALDCEDHLDDNCPPWDHELNLYLCIEGVSSDPTTCHERQLTVARWITPYGREARWLSGNGNAIALLSSAEAVAGRGTLHLHTWQHYTVSLTFWFHGPTTSLLPRSQISLWRGGTFDLEYNPSHAPITFDVPADTKRVTLSALITGHGWGIDEDNCAEFCDHSHHFAVNGITSPLLTKSHPVAGSDDGCKKKVSLGVVPNQYGTWPFGRAGWCPGQHVEWWEVDVTPWLKEGSNSITYHAYFNGTDYDPAPGGLEDDLGFAAEIHVASLLTFFSEEGHLEPVQLYLEPLEEENSTVLFP